MDSHIEFILSQCAQRMYLLKLLRHQGLPDVQLSVVAYAVIISSLLYAVPVSTGLMFFTTSAAFWVYSVLLNSCGTYG